MVGRRLVISGLIGFGLILVFLPGFSRLQELKARQAQLEAEVQRLRASNQRAVAEIERLQRDPDYVEQVAREELGVARKGEIIYKLVPRDE